MVHFPEFARITLCIQMTRNGCSHPLGFPIRKSPDHSLLAASRGLSQLTTSFIAYLRQGIHTHALSSLTIKSTSHTLPCFLRSAPSPDIPIPTVNATSSRLHKLVFVNARQYSVVKDLDCLQQFSCQRKPLSPLADS